MGKYLKRFENHSAYEAAQSNLILPNVSLCTQEEDVHYNPYVDPYNGHDYVEIGSVKWATMNIGATAVTDTGLYFAWGYISGYTADQVGSGAGQKYFGWSDYKFSGGRTSPSAADMTKYNSTDGKTVLEASDDAVQANWGGSWRMPTTEEFQALSAATISAWTANYEGSDVNGLVLTSKADSSKKLFFPAVGYCNNGNVVYTSYCGYYWSSSLKTSAMKVAYDLYFDDTNKLYWQGANNRYCGQTVRGVIG